MTNYLISPNFTLKQQKSLLEYDGNNNNNNKSSFKKKKLRWRLEKKENCSKQEEQCETCASGFSNKNNLFSINANLT